MKRREWTMAEIRSIDESMTAKEHAERLGRTVASVQQMAFRHKLRTAKWARPAETRLKAVKMVERGERVKDVANQLGVYPSTVQAWLKKARA